MKNRNSHRQENITSRHIIKSFQGQAASKRTFSEKTADFLVETFGSVIFLVLNALWFVFWIVANLGLIPGMPIFDPFPFGLLTMIVSLEAIFLSVFVLISQNRTSKVDDLREEVDLQVDVITEQELTKLMKMLALFMEKQGIDLSRDTEAQEMMQPTNMKKIQQTLERQVHLNKK